MVEDRVGERGLRHPGERALAAPTIHQEDLVLVGVEADPGLAHVVGDEEIDPLLFELRPSVGREVFRLGGEADDERAGPAGRELGEGKKLKEILGSMEMVAEGVETTRSVYQLAQRHGVTAAIITEIYKILYEDKDPRRALEDLMSREAHEELKQY